MGGSEIFVLIYLCNPIPEPKLDNSWFGHSKQITFHFWIVGYELKEKNNV